jgi:hypothetical protein
MLITQTDTCAPRYGQDLRIVLAATVWSSAVNERATNSSTCFDDALLRYLSETTMRGRRRRFFRQGRWVILLLAALLTCQWPDVRSDAADAAEREAKQRTVGLAAFACPQLADLLAQHTLPPASLERLRFADNLLASGRWSL